MLLEYILIFNFLIILVLLAFILFFISYIFVLQSPNSENISTYECGFNPFGDARQRFEINYFIVAILYIIFDVELLFLLPWVLSLPYLSLWGIYAMFLFLLLLTLGFIYEFITGALDW